MNPPQLHIQSGQHIWLSAEKAFYWEEEQALVLSDLHFGKTGHFRKSGIAVPQHIYRNDLHRLVALIQYFQPRKLIIVGDMFHSHSNLEMDLFRKWRGDWPAVEVHLVKGNHDILEMGWYLETGLVLHELEWTLGPFRFIHEPESEPHATYTFSGHLHPGILLRGGGKQSLRFPCFYFGKQHCVLPAFGGFTGLSLVEPRQGDAVYAIVEQQVIPFT